MRSLSWRAWQTKQLQLVRQYLKFVGDGVDGILQPFAGYAKLKFDLGTSEFADIGSSYAEFWPHHSSKERATDALVLIYERVLEQQKKML